MKDLVSKEIMLPRRCRLKHEALVSSVILEVAYNAFLSFETIILITVKLNYHHKTIKKLMFRALASRQS